VAAPSRLAKVEEEVIPIMVEEGMKASDSVSDEGKEREVE
jgi:hypothetical protein